MVLMLAYPLAKQGTQGAKLAILGLKVRYLAIEWKNHS